MKTYKKPISILVEVDLSEMIAGSPQIAGGTGEAQPMTQGVSTGNMTPEDGVVWGDSKEGSWE